MLSINQPLSQPAQTPAFKAAKKPSVKDLRKFQKILDEQAFIAKIKNPKISQEEKKFITINYFNSLWANSTFGEKAKMFFKALFTK